MRLITYESNGTWRAGIIIDDMVVDATVAATAANIDFDSEWISNRQIIQWTSDQLSRFERAV